MLITQQSAADTAGKLIADAFESLVITTYLTGDQARAHDSRRWTRATLELQRAAYHMHEAGEAIAEMAGVSG